MPWVGELEPQGPRALRVACIGTIPNYKWIARFLFLLWRRFCKSTSPRGWGEHITLSKSLKDSDTCFIWLEHIVGGSPKPLATGHKKQDIKYFTRWWNSVFFPSSMFMNEWSFLNANCSSGIPPKCTKYSTGRSRKKECQASLKKGSGKKNSAATLAWGNWAENKLSKNPQLFAAKYISMKTSYLSIA